MKIVFSRKGFDSGQENGRVASPILPGGRLASLPIPERGPNPCARPYAELRTGGVSAGKLVADLTGGRIGPADRAHLDPDLDRESRPRAAGWRPLFGQANAAESHLQNQGVGPGDLFLFFGWFRAVELVDGRYRYCAGSPDLHVLFGWLQVAERIPVRQPQKLPAWSLEHPHCGHLQSGKLRAGPYGKEDALYLSTDELRLNGKELGVPGGGLFRQFDRALQLTVDDDQLSRSWWSLPVWMHPEGRGSCLSYHGRADRWKKQDGQVLLQTVGRGQEFVLDTADFPEAVDWVRELIRDCRLQIED